MSSWVCCAEFGHWSFQLPKELPQTNLKISQKPLFVLCMSGARNIEGFGKSGPVSYHGSSHLLNLCLVPCRHTEQPFTSTQSVLLPNSLPFLEVQREYKHRQMSERLMQAIAESYLGIQGHLSLINRKRGFDGHGCCCRLIMWWFSHTVLTWAQCTN